MSFTDRKPFTVTADDIAGFKRGGIFNCKLCGRDFEPGDTVRWIYCNGTPGMQTGNFFVCAHCDAPDAVVRAMAKTDFDKTFTAAKKWGLI